MDKVIENLTAAINASWPLLYVVGVEDDPIEAAIATVAQSLNRPVRAWNCVTGWAHSRTQAGPPTPALTDTVKDAEPGTIYVFRDMGEKDMLASAPVVQAVKSVALKFKQSRSVLILTGCTPHIPAVLAEYANVISVPLPNAQEIEALIQTHAPHPLEVAELAACIKAGLGLSRNRITQAIALILATQGYLSQDAMVRALDKAKKDAIRQSKFLEFTAPKPIGHVGGLSNFKRWISLRKGVFEPSARDYGIPYPKGVLLVGIQGTGKSLSAKVVASEFDLPLVRFDIGRVFNALVGESEAQIRQALQDIEAISPCVLWIDEIDKGFSRIGGNDGGITQRVFATLLSWMQEKNSPVFTIATANNISQLPPELLRKGRFDDIFFVDLPDLEERRDIFLVHLERVRPTLLRRFDVDTLAQQTEGFSGAEIEQAIIDAMQQCFATVVNGKRMELSTEAIIRSIGETTPLSKISKEQIKALRQWADESGTRSAGLDPMTRQLKERQRSLKESS